LRQRLSINRYFVSRTTPLTWNFHFAFPAAELYRQLPLLRSFSAFDPEPKNRTRPTEHLPEPKGHDLPHFEAIS